MGMTIKDAGYMNNKAAELKFILEWENWVRWRIYMMFYANID